MSNLWAARMQTVRPRLLTAGTVVLLFLTCNYLIVHSQNGTTDLKGKTRQVLATANRSVDAGEIVFKVDTDHDGISDEDELSSGLNPNNPADADADNDGDGLTNGDEIALGTNPRVADTDGDGFSDAEEITLGFNPLDPTSHPQPGAAVVSLRVSPNILGLNINSVLGPQPVQLTVTGVLADGSTVDLTRATGTTYQSANAAVALVDSFGTVVASAPGSTAINVRNGNLTAQASVVVSSFSVEEVGSINLIPTIFNVDVAGDYAYLAAGAAGLLVVDVTNRRAPSLAASLDTSGNALNVEVIANRAYVADGPNGIAIVDVTNPLSPVLAGAADTPGDAQDVAISGSRAYVADGLGGLRVFDISNPQSPAPIGSLTTAAPAQAVDVNGNLAVLAEGSAGIQVVDISNPVSPLSLATLATTDAHDVKLDGTIAYVGDGAGSLRIVDLSTPSAPRLVASTQEGIGGNLLEVEKVRNLILGADVFSFRTTVPIIDVSNTASPLVRGYASFSIFGRSRSIAADDRFVYVTTPGNTFLIAKYFLPNDTAGIAPAIALSSPQSGQTVMEAQNLRLSASASDDVFVSRVEFSVNGQVVFTDTESPYEFDFRAPLNVASLTVTATAFDQAGSSATAGPVTVSVIADPPPAVTITLPNDSSVLIEGQPTFLAALASDNVSITQVVFTVNGVSLPAITIPPYTKVFNVPIGATSLAIQATATDNLGRSTTATKTVNVRPDLPPTVSITSPAAGAQLIEGDTIALAADASDDIRVDRVVFNVNGVDVRTFTGQPYNLNFTVPSGISNLTFTVTATDSFGHNTTVSRTVSVIPDPPPVVTITSPAEGAQVDEGETITVTASATDNGSVTQVVFTANGNALPADTAAPYSQQFTVPIGATSLTVQATATDNRNQSTTVSRTVGVVRVATTVSGRVTDISGASIEGATVALDNSSRFTATNAQGEFSFNDVTAAPQGIRVSVSVSESSTQRTGKSAVVPAVRDGITDLGVIVLASQATTSLPTTPSATARGDFTGDSLDDLFVGFPDRQSRIYVSDGNGSFNTSASLTLPFGAVRSGAGIDLNDDGFADILAQPVGQSGSVIAVFTDGAGGLLSTATISTGLGVESESMAAGVDHVGNQRRVLAFLAAVGGTKLTVVFSDGAGGFTAPVVLPVDASAQLRSLKFYDVNDDLLPDLIAIKQLPGGDARLVVFTRISETEFGAAIESAITVRNTSASATLIDYAVGDFDADLLDDVAVIGNDRVRIYKGDGTGAFTLLSDVPLPAGVTASAIATPYAGAAVGDDLIVVARDSVFPDHKLVLLYENTGFPGNASFAQPARLNYTVPPAATGDSRLLIGHFGAEAFIEDAIVIDGETITAFLDVVR